MESTATTTMAANDTSMVNTISTNSNITSPFLDTGQVCRGPQLSPVKGQAINFINKSPKKETTLMSTKGDNKNVISKISADNESVSSLSDVENFMGKIVYNPDGSAYIIEGPDSDASDVEAEISQEGSIIDAAGMTPPYGQNNVVFPQIVSAFHISRSSAAALYSALYGQAYQSLLQENKVPEVPIMHSYRVFTLKDGYNPKCVDSVSDQTDVTKLSGTDFSNKDNNNTIRVNHSESSAANSASNCQTVPVKPILMCFICKLSFGYSKSFIAHSIQEHNIALNDEEKRVLSSKNTSAIIQCIGKDKEPLLSFLEPRHKAPALTPNELPVQLQQQLESQQRLLMAAAAAMRQNSCTQSSLTTATSAGTSTLVTTQAAMRKASLSTDSLVSSLTSPVTSAPDIKPFESHSSALNFILPKNGDDHHYESTEPMDTTTPTPRETTEADTAFAPELADLANLEKIAKAAAAAAQQQQIEQMCQLSATHQPFHRSPSPSKTTSPKSPMTSTTPLQSQMPYPSGSPTNASPLLCSQHPDGGHMTAMHSRNSCKTLKCPKCNWHYKYQETLEIHMKEKHPENEMNCIYCLANQPHPRLARGETYTCGYKPYRCEVCNYSTTTKGNLSIHMQSDKHINNVQEIQNGNIPAEHLLQSQALAAAVAANATGVQPTTSSVPTTTTSASSCATSPAPSVPKETPKAQQVVNNGSTQSTPTTTKQKATWRCDVCNYETNVARNLRIHMTSEKHTHNLMVLKQNVSHMQQLSALQQAGMITPEQLFQFHPGLFAAAAGLTAGQPTGPGDNLQPEAALADMAYNHALLMMASQQQQHRAMAAAMMQQQQQQQQLQPTPSPGNKSPVARISGTGSQPTYDIEHPDPSMGLHNVPYDDTCRLFQCCVCGIYSSDSIEGLSQHIQCDRTRQREDEVLMAVGGSYICKLCSYKTNLKANFQLHCKTDKHLQRLQHVNHIKEGGNQSEWKLKYVNVSNPVQVRCNVCDYYTNSIHKLQLHTANTRHDACSRVFLHLQLAETLVKSGGVKYYMCVLCNHPARTKISLVQHINSIKHIRNESIRQLKQQQTGSIGMKDSEEEIRELFQVKELDPNDKVVFESDNNTNDDISGSLPLGTTIESMNDSMLKNALLEQQQAVVAQMSAKMNNEMSEGLHFCPFCNYSHTSEVRLQMHIVSTHSKQQQSQSTTATTTPTSAAVGAVEQHMLCPLCQEGFHEKCRLESHLIDVHNVKQEGLPKLMLLVEEVVVNKQQSHQTIRQNCSPQWSPNDETFEQREIDAKSDYSGDSGSKICEDELFDTNSLTESLQCPGCPKIFLTLDELFTHINSEGHLKMTTDVVPNARTGATIGNSNSGYQCWKRGCGQMFKTIAATQLHFKEQHTFKGKISGAAVSDRHVYRYRCSQCSLAFKTVEKLQLHSQYHLIRAATQCVFCGRSFRSMEALHKHIGTTHTEMNEEELETYKNSLINNPLLMTGRNGGGILDPSTTELLKKESNRMDDSNTDDEAMDLVIANAINPISEDIDEDMTDLSDNKEGLAASNHPTNSLEDFLNSQAVAEDSYNDPTRKYKCHRCRVAFTRQSYLTSHNKTLLHRKGEKLSYPMEKYLDPNRPYKCDIYKEKMNISANNANNANNQSNSQNISSVVMSTVATVSNPTPITETVTALSNAINSSDMDKKPYKCNICKVAYNLGTTLDIHVRSVLHQTKASKLHDLALTGQIDLSVPLIERPDNTSETAVTMTTPSTPTSGIPSVSVTTSPPKMSADIVKRTPSTPSPSTTPNKGVQESLMALNVSDPQQAALLQQALAMTTGNNGHNLLLGSSPFQCQRCGSAFISQEAQLQHQQLCCLFSPPNNSTSKQSTINQLRSQSPIQSNEQQNIAQTSQLNTQSNSSGIKAPKFASYAPVCRSKPPLYKHLLETWGFEIVMQFNECHQKRVKKDNNNSNEPKKDTDTNTNTTTPTTTGTQNNETNATEANSDSVANKTETNESEVKKSDLKNNLPEINRSKCDKCGKEFSSIWVLKAHREEIHKDVVPLDIVETFADDYRNEYERKCALEEENEASTDQINANDMQQIASGVNTNPSNTPPLSMANNMVNSGSTPAQADMSVANQMAAHLQFSQLLMSMGLAGMGMPMNMGMNMNMNMPFAAMGLHPPLIPVMMSPHLDPMIAAAFQHPGAAGMVNPPNQSTPSASPMPNNDQNFFANQQKLMQQQQQQLNAAAQQQKRARTRISDEQLKVLRQYFDINNSPTEEQLLEMSEKSGLPLKVIKHWFRNTLFKERQRNKDSPYNFNNPPSTFFNLEEYEKTGETKIITLNDLKKEDENIENKDNTNQSESEIAIAVMADMKSSSSTKDTDYGETSDDEICDNKKKETNLFKSESESIQEKFENHILQLQKQQQQQQLQQQIQLQQQQQQEFELTKAMLNTNTNSPHTSESSMSSQSAADMSTASLFSGLPGFAASLGQPLGSGPLQMALDAHRSQISASNSNTPNTSGNGNSGSGGSSGKRANRTRFTDYQIKVLQEFFESNAYPKDDDLEYLSKLLNLSPRVIVVWFQNARQKARKVYENQPQTPQEDDGSGRFQRTPGLNYQCKKCMQVFQRYYELIKHQKSACFKDENPLAAQLRAAAESRAQSTSPGVSRETPSTTPTPVDSGRITATPDKLAHQSPSTPTPQQSQQSSQQQQQQSGVYRCEKCSLVFNRYELWREHQLVHLMNPNLFPSFPPSSPFGILQFEAQQSPQTNTATSPNSSNPLSTYIAQQSQQQAVKRKLPEDEDSHDYDSLSGIGTSSDQPRDKRLRTTILPEQLDYLYQKYQIESNPSRKMLESIAKEVGLKKRVVQVWFQNTRARERKGQFRAHQQVIHKRCPFCRALFKARSALESHLATRHADQYTKGDINIDALPDGDPSDMTDSSPTNTNEDIMRNSATGGLTAEALQSTMKKYYEDSFKKYLEELNIPGTDGQSTIPADLSLKMKAAFEASGLTTGESAPLDLSKPVDLSQPLRFSTNDDEGFDDTRSDGEDSDSSDENEFDFYFSYESNPTSPAPGSTTSSSASAMNRNPNSNMTSHSNSNSNKRYRTQMTTVMLKVMKSIFADYKTPSMAECECLGREVGLPKRVVQVWFQNARAKEKKAKLAFAKTFGQEFETNTKPIEECKICGIKYNLKFSSTAMQDHLFSKKHIENLKLHIDSVKKLIEGQDDNSSDFPIASGIELPVIPTSIQNNMNTSNIASDSNDNRSKSAANLMQQLQLMGLSGAMPAGLTLSDMTVNGGNNKNFNEQKTPEKSATPNLNCKDSNSSSSSGSGGMANTSDLANDNSGLLNYMYPGLQNYYTAAGAFMHPNMYGTAANSTEMCKSSGNMNNQTGVHTSASNVITTNGVTMGSSNEQQVNNFQDMSSMYMNGNDANIINYLTKNMNNNGIQFTNFSDNTY
ncbi:zinc finger homeobox protein 4-like isoform X2 [Oppia nitens]|uniref:zinc finger homeobox protein 4-like isoform X2 n=1 Tax=Oppia nitens TaxID=1686743 RepID=UPI0023DB20A7|nr:zinc finger homeobox protein 4-like isoform X2 [Oppia nitens]